MPNEWLEQVQLANIRFYGGDPTIEGDVAAKAEFAQWAETPTVTIRLGSALWDTLIELNGQGISVTRLQLDLNASAHHGQHRIRIETEHFVVEGDLLEQPAQSTPAVLGVITGSVGVRNVYQIIAQTQDPPPGPSIRYAVEANVTL